MTNASIMVTRLVVRILCKAVHATRHEKWSKCDVVVLHSQMVAEQLQLPTSQQQHGMFSVTLTRNADAGMRLKDSSLHVLLQAWHVSMAR